MHLYDSELYMQDVCAVASMIQVQELAGASVLISGGTGMIGSFLIDALLYANKNYGAQTETRTRHVPGSRTMRIVHSFILLSRISMRR